jgi:predicted chitinase
VMSEYCLTWWQYRDIKDCLDKGDLEGIRDIIYAMEMRNVTMKIAEFYQGNCYNIGG